MLFRSEKEMERKYSAESIYRNTERKKKIAACAYEFIEDRDTIIIDDASSSFYLAVHIRQHPEKRLAVVTNSLLVGNELAGVSHVELYMVGGHVGGHLAATMGDDALSNIELFHVDKGFIGIHSINFDVGLTSIATPQMQVKRRYSSLRARHTCWRTAVSLEAGMCRSYARCGMCIRS